MKNVFTTEQEAIDAQEVDFQMYKASRPEMPVKYWETTTAWDKVRKREDAEEWYYEVCPVGIQTHEQAELAESWIASE
jgi:hypothetical protein